MKGGEGRREGGRQTDRDRERKRRALEYNGEREKKKNKKEEGLPLKVQGGQVTAKHAYTKYPRGWMGKPKYPGKKPLAGRRENPININPDEHLT